MDVNKSRSYIIQWNNLFPLDHWYRKKYNIPFGSQAHRAISQLEIYFEWLEERIYEEHALEVEEKLRKEKLYKSGEWISERIDEEIEDDLFDKIQL